MTAVAAARNSLQSKLDRNRKVRPAKIDELSASMDLVDHNADQNFAVSWDDSFIMGKDSGNPEIRKAASIEVLKHLFGDRAVSLC